MLPAFPEAVGGRVAQRGATSPLSWLLLAWWCAAFTALQGLLASRGVGPWLPDVGLVFLAALVPRTSSARARRVALVLAAARIALCTDPPVAVLAGYLGLAGLHRAIGSTLNVEGSAARFVMTSLFTWGLLAWLVWVHLVRHPELAAAESFAWPSLVPAAVATGLVAALFAPLVARLPGVTPLWRGRPA